MSEFDPNIPIYQQIVERVKRDIVSGTQKPGDRLCSVREMAESLAVNPNTVQRAYQELEREGISETRRGMGTYIVERENLIETLTDEMAESVVSSFVKGMRALGFGDEDIVASLQAALAGGKH